MSPIGISIVVITRNEAANIRDCLDSLTAVDYPPDRHEILVVDASTDATPRIAGAYPRVRVLRSAAGFSRQKNAGLRAAAFDVVAFTDADCIIPPDWLRVADRVFGGPDAPAGIGGNAYPPPGTSRFGLWSACVGHPGGGAIGFDANVGPDPRGVSFLAGCNAIFRKAALRAAGGFHPGFQDGGEDVDVSRRLRARGDRLDYVPDLTVFHKARPTLRAYVRWNLGVGGTKFNLRRPSVGRLLAEAGGPALIAAAWLWTSRWPAVFLAAVPALWLLAVLGLIAATRPYPLLLRRRRRIGVGLAAVLTVVPALVLVRQAAILGGQFKKWRRRRDPALRLDFGAADPDNGEGENHYP